ncbi:MAG: hypothetical protein IPJ30_10445 [Acidobacteria bacterium]|nr:hypothetical protein [Acidobacteriota bacterium]
MYDAFAGFNFATAQFSQIVPKSIALRNPQVRAGAADAMWSGAAVYNGFAGTYNLGAWGANSASGGDGIPYAPILSPDENTSGAGKFFYYGTTGGMLVNGGAGLIKSFRTAAASESALLSASQTAFAASKNVSSFNVPLKHLAGAAGRYGKFNTSDVAAIRSLLAEALKSQNATFLSNKAMKSFMVITDLERQIGTKGQTKLKIIVGENGKIWTAYPVN